MLARNRTGRIVFSISSHAQHPHLNLGADRPHLQHSGHANDQQNLRPQKPNAKIGVGAGNGDDTKRNETKRSKTKRNGDRKYCSLACGNLIFFRCRSGTHTPRPAHAIMPSPKTCGFSGTSHWGGAGTNQSKANQSKASQNKPTQRNTTQMFTVSREGPYFVLEPRQQPHHRKGDGEKTACEGVAFRQSGSKAMRCCKSL